MVSNSIAYTPLGGRIEIRAEADEECIFYFIEDTGKGFTLKDMEKAMEDYIAWTGEYPMIFGKVK